ncbi:hypothetical protein DFH28DRAFT_983862 [Melampsora americana]|nr:hypothetical protein DFH28DRAFT_983862 [Melampsora americana]
MMIKESFGLRMQAKTLVLVMLIMKLHVSALPMGITGAGEALDVAKVADGLNSVKTADAVRSADPVGALKVVKTADTVKATNPVDTAKTGFTYHHNVDTSFPSGEKLKTNFRIENSGTSPYNAELVGIGENVRTKVIGTSAHDFPVSKLKGSDVKTSNSPAKISGMRQKPSNPTKPAPLNSAVSKASTGETSALGGTQTPATSDGFVKVLKEGEGKVATSPVSWKNWVPPPFQKKPQPSVAQDVKSIDHVSGATPTAVGKPATTTSFLGNLGTSARNRLNKATGYFRGKSGNPVQSSTLDGHKLNPSVTKAPTGESTSSPGSWRSYLSAFKPTLRKSQPSVAQDINKAADQSTSARKPWISAYWKWITQASRPKTASTSELTGNIPGKTPGFLGRLYNQPAKLKPSWNKIKGRFGSKPVTPNQNEVVLGGSVSKQSSEAVPTTTPGYGQRIRENLGKVGQYLNTNKNKIGNPRELIQKSWDKVKNSAQTKPKPARIDSIESQPLLEPAAPTNPKLTRSKSFRS